MFQAPRPPPQGPSRRRGKKSDDNGRNHHVNHQHLSDQELEQEIFQDKSSFSSGLRPPPQEPASRRTQGIRDKTDTIVQIQAAGTKNKKSLLAEISALPAVTEVHRVQGERGFRIIRQTSMQNIFNILGTQLGKVKKLERACLTNFLGHNKIGSSSVLPPTLILLCVCILA